MLPKNFLLAAVAVAGTNAASAVLDLIPKNFDKIVHDSGKPALVEFFAPWCGHCKKLAPIYEELAQSFQFASEKVSIGKVDADEHKSLGSKYGIQGFPTLKWFDGKGGDPETYSSGRDLESLQAFITEKTGVKPKKKGAIPSEVVMLDDKSFSEKIGKGQDVLVAFTAPWCGHCKSLAPTWETLAHTFSPEETVLIAKVDAEGANSKATAQSQGVKSYPTIKYFPKGSTEAQAYEGGRSEKDFITFLNKHAGTHRAVGGGLDATAGTIEALDTIVSKVVGAGTWDKAVEELTAAAKTAKGKYAEYYVKAATKLAANKDYATKELARLQGMLKKGGLAQQKVDDLTSRSNILQKFLVDDKKDEL